MPLCRYAASAPGNDNDGAWGLAECVWTHVLEGMQVLLGLCYCALVCYHPLACCPAVLMLEHDAQVTPAPYYNTTELFGNFTSNADLIGALVASSYIPMWSGPGESIEWRGQPWVDGGIGSSVIPCAHFIIDEQLLCSDEV